MFGAGRRRADVGVRASRRRGLAASAVAALALAGVFAAGVPAGAASGPSDDWATFRYNALHDGLSPDKVVTAAAAPSFAVQWQANSGGGTSHAAPIDASPAVVHNSTLGQSLL